MASFPATNFEAPSMAPKKFDSGFELLAALPGLGLVDEAGRKVGVDRHLLSRHRIQGEARRHFGDASGTLGDHDEVHDHEDRKHDQADDEIALRDKPAKRLNDQARRVRCLHFPRARMRRVEAKVEGHAQHGGDQEHSREGTEFERLPDED